MEIYRTLFKEEIISEFAIPQRKSSKVLIICSGMPGSPSKKDLIEKFVKKNFWVFLPRYRGTWESKGKFLEKSPEKDILDVIECVQRPIIELWDKKKYFIKNPEIYVLGVSFGGPAAILVSKHEKVKKVLAISPVIDWKVDSKKEPLDKLGRFVKEAFGRAYDFDEKDWRRLSKGDFYNPINETEKADGKKIWIIHAKDDDIVPYWPSLEFAKKTSSKITLFKQGGHDLARKLLENKKFFKKIINWFN